MRRFHLSTAIYVVLLAGMAFLAVGLSSDPPPVGHADRDLGAADVDRADHRPRPSRSHSSQSWR